MTADPGPSPPPQERPAPTGPPLEQDFDAGSLYMVRAAASAHAAAAGLSRQRVYDVTSAVHELAANAVIHGGGHGRLRLWTRDGYLYCRVSDNGPVGAARPPEVPWPVGHGHGLWIVAQVADNSSIDHGPAGTTVTARFALTPQPASRSGPAAAER
jgi:anti-sigma regulatory factor (Ser/Thr protein kinase)